MTSVPVGYLRIADQLLRGDIIFSPVISVEARRRTAINRYYYAINRLGDYYLEEFLNDALYCGTTKKYHVTITNRLFTLGGRERRRIAERMGQLYTKREDADYTNSYRSLESDAQFAKKQAWQIKEIFDDLLNKEAK